ncbi:hypothetical protein EVAR_34566_1 [Eumeta japonica]|uniref:Uncharacterized protein n=1 Tax=Eumeta variegata TaxID=151549 RepID=A0A4C1X5Y3_EUMVA|nr:hypothetical protein EVAR_34566_1 [Eumeta japonica]
MAHAPFYDPFPPPSPHTPYSTLLPIRIKFYSCPIVRQRTDKSSESSMSGDNHLLSSGLQVNLPLKIAIRKKPNLGHYGDRQYRMLQSKACISLADPRRGVEAPGTIDFDMTAAVRAGTTT